MMICTNDEYQRTLVALKEHAEHIEQQRQLFEREGLSLDQVERALQPTRSFAAGLREEAEAFERLRRGDLGSLRILASVGRWWSEPALVDSLGV